MAAQFLQLKLRLLGNSVQRSTWRLVGLIIGLVYGLGAGVFIVASLIGLRLAQTDVAERLVTVGGSLIVLGFLLVPLVLGVDDTMDPRKFSLFGVEPNRLANGLALAALVSVPSLVIAVVAVAQIVTWSRGFFPTLLALVCAALIIATCVIGARVTTSIAAFLLSTRRARDATATTGFLLLVLLSPVAALLAGVDWGRDGLAVVDRIATVAGWTPLGAVWAAPSAAAAGQPAEALAKVLIALVFAGALWFAWRALVSTMVVTPPRMAQAKSYHGLGWFDVLPSTATGAIAARSLTYWSRDARYFVSLVIVPIVPILIVIPLMVAGIPASVLALIPVPVAALFLSWSIHNDVAFDNTALWLHVVSDTKGRADRMGRAIPALLVGTPLLVLGALVSAKLSGDTSVLPSLLGVSIGILLSGLGLSSIMSARFPYPVVHPGDSPFSQPQSTGTAAALIQSLSFLATFVLASPAIIFAALGLSLGGTWPWASFAAGIGLGLFVLLVGVRWGGWIFERRATNLLAFSMRN